jgi:hypothetical protein
MRAQKRDGAGNMRRRHGGAAHHPVRIIRVVVRGVDARAGCSEMYRLRSVIRVVCERVAARRGRHGDYVVDRVVRRIAGQAVVIYRLVARGGDDDHARGTRTKNSIAQSD